MEQLNRIELRGMVGSVNTQIYEAGQVSHFTVATNHAYKDRNGGAVIDTTWHNVTAWENKEIQDLDKIGKGTKVHVVGRVRYNKYTGIDGVERNNIEVLASKVNIINDSNPMQCEM